MHYDSENCPHLAMVFWLTMLTCFGIWSAPVAQAQTESTEPPSTVAPSVSAPAADQIMLPPADDIPEEILRTEIIFEARSPLDGRSMQPADYAQLQTELATRQTVSTLSHDIRYLIFLLQTRRAVAPLIPFWP